ncbi:hypothetical protein BV898_01324 [Hypsibius exemplaris]|uniref:Uncharacterized protein n=1 Tax=Hypsibius exemplaris TaxID=2072580 RepID=A0A1W0XBT0_HYPEX|nr:hypothetical protein BV898_01324 [Hypsibius exemplaris]
MQEKNGHFSLFNSSEIGALNCQLQSGSSKYSCEQGSIISGFGLDNGVSVRSNSTGITWTDYPNQKPAIYQDWLYPSSGSSSLIGTLIIFKMPRVTSMLNIDGKQTAVFGKDAADKLVAGVMTFPTDTATAVAGYSLHPATTIKPVTVPSSSNCNSATFCEAAFDWVHVSNPKDASKSSSFFFQGKCVQQFNISEGKLSAVGAAAAISTLFQGTPSGPIVRSVDDGNSQFTFVTASGLGALFKGHVAEESGTAYEINNFKLANFTAMINIDGARLALFGKDAAGKALAALFTIPVVNAMDSSWATPPGPMFNVMSCYKLAPSSGGIINDPLGGASTTTI